MSDALAVGVWLNVFIRQSRYISMANIAQSVNVISPLMTTPTGIVKQTTWWPLWLFSKYMRGSTVAVHVRCEEYDGATEPTWIRGTIDTPWLDVSAAVDTHGTMTMAVVNVHPTRSFRVDVTGVTGPVDVYTVTGPDLASVNTAEASPVGVSSGTWDGRGRFEFPKHSLTMLRWRP